MLMFLLEMHIQIRTKIVLWQLKPIDSITFLTG